MAGKLDEQYGPFGPIALFVVVLLLFWENYPSLVLAIITGYLAILTAGSQSIWLKAAYAMLLPACLGFALITLLQLYFNWGLDLDAYPIETRSIAAAEYTLLKVADTLPALIKLGWLPSVLILLALIPLSAALARYKPVTTWLWTQKLLGRLIGVLAVATTFSFFTGEEVLGEYEEKAREHVRLVYNASRQRELQHLASMISSEATSEAIRSLPPEGRNYIEELLELNASLQPLSDLGRAELLKTLGKRHALTETRPVSLDYSSRAIVQATEIEKALYTEPQQVIERQFEREAHAKQSAAEERTRAIEEILNRTLTLPTGQAKALAEAFFTQIMGEQVGLFLKEAVNYLGKVTETYFKRLMEPAIKQAASRIQAALYPASAEGVEPAKLAVAQIKAVLHELAITRPHKLVKSGLEKLNRATYTSHFDLYTAKSDAKEYFREAENHIRTYGPAYINTFPSRSQGTARAQINQTERMIEHARTEGSPSEARLQEIYREIERLAKEREAMLRRSHPRPRGR